MDSWKFLSPSLPPLLVMAKQELITAAGRSCCRRRSLVFSFFFLCEFLLFLISFSSFLLLCIDDWFCIAFAFSMTDAFATKLHANQKLLQRRDIVWRTGSATHVPSGLCEENTVCFSSIVIFLLVCVKDPRLFLKSRHLPSGLCEGNPSVSQVSSSSFWFDKTCLFLKSRHLPSDLCEENLSVSRVSSSSFWFVWRKRSLFLNYRLKFPSTIQIGEIRSVYVLWFLLLLLLLVQLLEGCESVCKSPERFLTVVIVSDLLDNLNWM